MKQGTFSLKLVDNIECPGGSGNDITELLNSVNLKIVNSHMDSGSHIDYFVDDMAIAKTVIEPVVTDEGRIFNNLEVSVLKLGKEDKQLILELVAEKYLQKEVKLCP